MLRIRCQCGKSLRLGAELVGKPVRCPSCAGRLRVVAGGQLSDEANASGVLMLRDSPSGECEQIHLAGRQSVSIGKASDAPLRLQAPSVSRHHSILKPYAGGWRLCDDQSTNGTFVNGESIEAHSLADGDVIHVGDFTFVYRLAASPGLTAAPKAASSNGLQLIDDDDLDRTWTSHMPTVPVPQETPASVAAAQTCPTCSAVLDASSRLCINCGTNLRTGERLQIELSEGGEGLTATPLAVGRYMRDCLSSFLLVLGFGNLIKFVFIALIGAFGLLNLALPFGGGILILAFRFMAVVICGGWICSYLFSVVVSGAAGDDDLPDMTFEDGIWDGGFVPFFKFLGTWVLVMVPAIAYAIVAGLSAGTQDTVLSVLIWFGIAVWPFVVLITALGGLECLARPDLIARTIARTFVPYAAACAATAGAFMVAHYGGELAAAQSTALGGNRWATSALIVVLNVGCWIVAMRCVGLYYHHFKDRFAWSWG